MAIEKTNAPGRWRGAGAIENSYQRSIADCHSQSQAAGCNAGFFVAEIADDRRIRRKLSGEFSSRQQALEALRWLRRRYASAVLMRRVVLLEVIGA